MERTNEAFRTISEVADDLDVRKHVLRFWEGRFPQIRPMKRGGGRRYYRPEDVELLRGIRRLLYDEGYTIKGVQKLIRDNGLEHVKAFSGDGNAHGTEGAAGLAAAVAGAAGEAFEKKAGTRKAGRPSLAPGERIRVRAPARPPIATNRPVAQVKLIEAALSRLKAARQVLQKA